MPLLPRVDMTVWWASPEGRAACVLNYSIDVAPADPSEWALVVDAFSDMIRVEAKNIIPSECSYVGVTGRFISPAVSFAWDSNVGNGPGVVAGDTCPSEVSVIVRKLGIGPSKNANGTMFIPFVPESLTNNSRLTADGLGTYIPFVNLVLTGQEVSGTLFNPKVMSRKTSTLYSVFNGQVQSILGHQSRRRPLR